MHAAHVHAKIAQCESEIGWPLAERFEKMGAKIASIRPDQPSAVRLRLEVGDFDAAEKLIKAGAPANYIDEHGECALHLLSPGATKASLAQLALFLARPEMKPLVEKGSMGEGTRGERPLHWACAALNRKGVELLLAAGADINARDDAGWTPLRHLLRKTGKQAQEKALPLLRFLVEKGADPSIPDAKGRTAAQAVAGKAPVAAIAELLELRPQDLADGGLMANEARKKLRQRGGAGLSIAERADLKEQLAAAAASTAAAGPQGEADASDASGSAKSGAKRRPRSL